MTKITSLSFVLSMDLPLIVIQLGNVPIICWQKTGVWCPSSGNKNKCHYCIHRSSMVKFISYKSHILFFFKLKTILGCPDEALNQLLASASWVEKSLWWKKTLEGLVHYWRISFYPSKIHLEIPTICDGAARSQKIQPQGGICSNLPMVPSVKVQSKVCIHIYIYTYTHI